MEETRIIKKALIPVAGFGTRMLPATKAVPKELLPILDKPLIQRIIEEAKLAGINEVVLVTRSGKEAIENHLDRNYELETLLTKSKKKEIIKKFPKHTLSGVSIISVRQETPLGLGHAIKCASHVLKKGEAFAVILPDELLISSNNKNDLKKMISNYSENGNGQILVEKVSKSKVSDFGVIDIKGENLTSKKSKFVNDFVEKPSLKKAPSNLRIVGRYILDNKVFDILESQERGSSQEIQLTDAISSQIGEIPCFGYKIKDERFDCGSKLGFLQANVSYALNRNDLNSDLTNWLKTII